LLLQICHLLLLRLLLFLIPFGGISILPLFLLSLPLPISWIISQPRSGVLMIVPMWMMLRWRKWGELVLHLPSQRMQMKLLLVREEAIGGDEIGGEGTVGIPGSTNSEVLPIAPPQNGPLSPFPFLCLLYQQCHP
jgi:hypothetical protein